MSDRWAYANGGTGLVLHGACGLIWWQSGNHTSHCPRCHRTFTSLQGFDHHQRINKDAAITCIDPREAGDTSNRRLYVEVRGSHEGETVDVYYRFLTSSERGEPE